jgi:hypothetical protein
MQEVMHFSCGEHLTLPIEYIILITTSGLAGSYTEAIIKYPIFKINKK